MTDTYIINIQHFLDDRGELAEMNSEGKSLASFLVLLIDSATEAGPNNCVDTKIRCRSKDCRGSIEAVMDYAEHDISWDCPRCELNGVIRNWQNTKWDKRPCAYTVDPQNLGPNDP
jgi:hypothetical protein